MPGGIQAALSFFQFASIIRTEIPSTLTNRFIGESDAACCEEFFNFTETEADLMVQLDRMADNFRRKAMALIAGCFGFHAAQSASAT